MVKPLNKKKFKKTYLTNNYSKRYIVVFSMGFRISKKNSKKILKKNNFKKF